jgi:hypothetical protein
MIKVISMVSIGVIYSIATDAELIRNISIMNVGMQIINNHSDEYSTIIGGVWPEWIGGHKIQVAQQTLDTYNSAISEYQRRHPVTGQGQLKLD